MAIIAHPVREALEGIFRIFLRPLLGIYRGTLDFLNAVREWVRRQVADECEREGDGPLFFIIGSIIYSTLTLVFLLADFGMVVLTAEAMGFEPAAFEMPVDTSTLTAATLVTTAAFWGMIVLDLLGITRLAPWRKHLSRGLRRIFMALAVFFLGLSVAVALAMGLWRGIMSMDFVPSAGAAPVESTYFEKQGSVTSAPVNSFSSEFPNNANPPESFGGIDLKWLGLFAFCGLAVLSISSSAFSMVGVVIFAKFLVLFLIVVAVAGILPVTFCAWLICTVLDAVLNAVRLIFALPISIGNRVLGLFGWKPEVAADAARSPAQSTNQPSPATTRPPAEPSQPADPGFNPFRRRPSR
jgi:hypothetical protein